jgi:hypothetical protein
MVIDATLGFGKRGFDGTKLKNNHWYYELPIIVVLSSMHIWSPKLVYWYPFKISSKVFFIVTYSKMTSCWFAWLVELWQDYQAIQPNYSTMNPH